VSSSQARFDVNPDELFQEVVAALRLSMIIGPGVVRRALADGGADAKSATPAQYKEALGRIEARLMSYMTAAEAAQRIGGVRAILSRAR
jgi:hypothetical protein